MPSKKARRMAATSASKVHQTSNSGLAMAMAPCGPTVNKSDDRLTTENVRQASVGQNKKSRGDLESSSESAYEIEGDVDRTSSSEGAALLALASLLASRHALATEMSQHMESKQVEILEDLGTRDDDSNHRDAAFVKVQETDCEA